MEGIFRSAAVCGGIRQRIDDFEELDDRAGPAVRHDQRRSRRML
jgi:hypothetical protein